MTSYRPPLRLLHTLSLLVVILAGCVPATTLPVPNPTATAALTPEPTSMPTETPTDTPTSTPTAIRTTPALASAYQASLLNPLDTPHTYIQDTCQYLHDKWSSTNSAPGTVVMVIMIHAITGKYITPTENQISEDGFYELIGGLLDNGFEAITTAQLADFLEHNTKIPEHSVLLVADDRHHTQYFDQYFRPLWEVHHWPVVNAYISASRDSIDASIWKEQEILNAEGWVDYQAHGVVHNTPMWPGVSDAYITSELQGSIDAFRLHFNKTPIAIIWPGGGFSSRSVKIARQLGYQLGFTTTPRGPLMFDWIPLSDIEDPMRPSWVPEGSVNDPLLVLPRYWDTDAVKHIANVVQMGQEAAAYAGQNKATELEYYDIVCAAHYGPIP